MDWGTVFVAAAARAPRIVGLLLVFTFGEQYLKAIPQRIIRH
jgi:hypothetical protein